MWRFTAKSNMERRRLAGVLFLTALLSGCQGYLPQDMEETLQGEAARMEDGEAVSLWKDMFENESYRLSNVKMSGHGMHL